MNQTARTIDPKTEWASLKVVGKKTPDIVPGVPVDLSQVAIKKRQRFGNAYSRISLCSASRLTTPVPFSRSIADPPISSPAMPKLSTSSDLYPGFS